MDYLKDKIPDSKDASIDQKEFGYFIKNGKYFKEEVRGKNNSKHELSNFVMQILFHLENGTNNSKRIIKIQRYTGEVYIIEVASSEMKRETFETILKSKRCTFLGGVEMLNIIFCRLMDKELEASYIDMIGYIPAHNVYAFADSVFTSGNQLIKVDELGVITLPDENKKIYLPSSGIANNKDSSQDNKRLYCFRPGNLDFEKWAKLYYEAWESKGAIGILFLIISVFRDIIYDRVGFFPFLFLFGGAGSGKTSFVKRMLAVLGNDLTGIALNNSTITGLSRIVSTRNNSIFYFKEYTRATDDKAQDFILNAYDGAGRTTGMKTNDNSTQSFKIQSGIIFDGNELPQDKHAVFSRMILLSFESDVFTDSQKNAFEILKDEFENGFGNVLLEILQHRNYFKENFKNIFNHNLQELKDSGSMLDFSERMLSHIALLLTPAKLLWGKLPFPFDFKEITNEIIERARAQNSLLKSSNAVTIFWESFAYCVRSGYVTEYEEHLGNSKTSDYRVKSIDSIIQIRFKNLYPKYSKYCRENNIKSLDSNTLISNLTEKGNKSFIPGTQESRKGVTYMDKKFGSCYQFAFLKKENCIEINEVEIML